MSVTASGIPFLLLNDTLLKFVARPSTNATFMNAIVNHIYDTNMMDEKTLLKTLEEHGARNIEINNSKITCICDVFRLNFEKQGANKPYTLEVIANIDNDSESLVQDINVEYSANVQEISYNKIKERLEQKNLTIENEEVYDDNTIVLTVNLED